jgi:hypothetical protein
MHEKGRVPTAVFRGACACGLWLWAERGGAVGKRVSYARSQGDRAVFTGRADRHHCAHYRAETLGQPRQAVLCREHRPRRRQYGNGNGGEGGTGRLYHPRPWQQFHRQSEPLCHHSIRSVPRFRAGDFGRHHAECDRGPSVTARPQRERPHRAREGKPRQIQLCSPQHRHDAASCG